MRLMFAVLAAALLVAAVPPARIAAAQAGAITYAFTARPAGFADTFAPAAGAKLRFLTLGALDGNRIDAALWEPAAGAPAATTMIVAVHGSGANYRADPLDFLGKALSAKGYAMLAIDTRQHDAAINTDNFYDIRGDIQAAIYTARALGYKTIVLLGHSLGTVQVQYYAATDWSSDIKAVVLLAPFADLPWKSRNILIHDEREYADLTNAALAAVKNGTPAAQLPLKMGYTKGVDSAVTAQHFLTYRDQTTAGSNATFWIERIPRPILIVRDQSDGIILPFEPNVLLAAAGMPGSLVQGITYVPIADDRPPSLAGHLFTNSQQPLIDAVAGWLAGQHL